jgi:osmotically-inducible protein OsmY
MASRACSRFYHSLVFGCVLVALNIQGVRVASSSDWREVNDDISKQIAMLQPPIGPHTIEIDNQGRGEILLEGYVESEEARRRVQEAAERAHGVSRVDNHLAIAHSPQVSRSEEIIRMEEAFRRDVPKGRYNVTVVTEPDRVVLRGTADSQETRERLVNSATSVAKRTVSDQMIVQNVSPGVHVSDSELERTIQRVLREEYPLLIKELHVTVRNGVATIEGKLANHRQVDQVLGTLLDVDGVTDIKSEITINGRLYSRSATKPLPE